MGFEVGQLRLIHDRWIVRLLSKFESGFMQGWWNVEIVAPEFPLSESEKVFNAREEDFSEKVYNEMEVVAWAAR